MSWNPWSKNVETVNETNTTIENTISTNVEAIQTCGNTVAASNTITTSDGCVMEDVNQENYIYITTTCTQNASADVTTSQTTYQESVQTAEQDVEGFSCGAAASATVVGVGGAVGCSLPQNLNYSTTNIVNQYTSLATTTNIAFNQECSSESSVSNTIACAGGVLAGVTQSNYLEDVTNCTANQSAVVASYQDTTQSVQQTSSQEESVSFGSLMGLMAGLIVLIIIIAVVCAIAKACKKDDEKQKETDMESLSKMLPQDFEVYYDGQVMKIRQKGGVTVEHTQQDGRERAKRLAEQAQSVVKFSFGSRSAAEPAAGSRAQPEGGIEMTTRSTAPAPGATAPAASATAPAPGATAPSPQLQLLRLSGGDAAPKARTQLEKDFDRVPLISTLFLIGAIIVLVSCILCYEYMSGPFESADPLGPKSTPDSAEEYETIKDVWGLTSIVLVGIGAIALGVELYMATRDDGKAWHALIADRLAK